jgi:ABC-type Zn uptake system ZnuABC Zn-binding protein ZnuA
LSVKIVDASRNQKVNVFLVEKHASRKYVETIKTNVLFYVILQKIVPLLGNYKKDGKSRNTKEIAVYLYKLWCWCHTNNTHIRAIKGK